MSFWIPFTKLADTTVMMPLAFMLAGWLAYTRRWHAAVHWSLLFCVALTIVAISKIAYVGWGIGIASLDFKGFSGHAMRAAAVVPVFGYLMLQTRRRTPVLTTLILAFGFGIAIGVSRLILHEHSISEVLAGWLLGAVVSTIFLVNEKSVHLMPLNRTVIAACTLILIPGLLGKPAPTERWIEGVALYLSGREAPYGHISDKDTQPPAR